MGVTRKCTGCGYENSSDARFCSQCGQGLVAEEQIKVDLSKPVAEAKEKIDLYLTEGKHKSLEWVQEKVEKWAKHQYVIVTVSAGLVSLVLAFAGLKGLDASNKYEEMVEKASERVSKGLQYITDRSNKFNEESKAALSDLEEKRIELDEYSVDKIQAYEDKLKQQISRIDMLEEKFSKDFSKLDKTVIRVGKLLKSSFKIELHYYDSSFERRKKNIKYLVDKLSLKGYTLDNKKIANLKADKREIVAYTDNDKTMSEEISNAISEKFPSLDVTLKPYDYTNDYKVLIKLCSEVDENKKCVY